MNFNHKTYCIFAANYLPNLGGIERYTLNLSKELFDRSYKVIIVTNNVDKLDEIEVTEYSTIIRMPCFNFMNGRFPLPKLNRNFFKLIKNLLLAKPDYMIVNARFYIHSIVGLLVAKKCAIKSIVIEHGTDHFTVNNKLLDFLGRQYEHLETCLIKRICCNFYGVSEACNKWLLHYKIYALDVLYNSVDVDMIKHLMNEIDDSNNFRVLNNINSDAIIICYTGRLVKEKGIMKLFTAFKSFNSVVNNSYLVIAGDGDMEESLKKQIISSKIEDKVIMLGKIKFDEVIKVLYSSSIFCLPTDYPEGFPTSVLEAIAAKCYVITTKNGGSKEIIIDNSFGTILETNDEINLFNSLMDYYNNREQVEISVNKCFNLLVDKFSWKITVDKIEDAFSSRRTKC